MSKFVNPARSSSVAATASALDSWSNLTAGLTDPHPPLPAARPARACSQFLHRAKGAGYHLECLPTRRTSGAQCPPVWSRRALCNISFIKNSVVLFRADPLTTLGNQPDTRSMLQGTIGGNLTSEEALTTKAERAFHREAIEAAARLKREIGYNPTRFNQMVAELGGPEAARQLLGGRDASDGFTTLWEAGRLDMSVEAADLLPWYEPLFTEEQRAAARRRLIEHRFPLHKFISERAKTPPPWALEDKTKSLTTDKSKPTIAEGHS
jgi:hypothetical protein